MDRSEYLAENKYTKYSEIEKCIIEIEKDLLDPDDILVLITRKGYWAYILFVDPEEQIEHKKKIKIFSDRYYTKCIDFSVLLPRNKNKESVKIVIFDDTMNSGVNLFYFYAYFCKQGQEKVRELDPQISLEVIPYAYALNTSYAFNKEDEVMICEYMRLCREDPESNDEKRKYAIKMIENFNRDLQWKIRLSPENIGRIRRNEIKWFQDRMSPMVVDLPIVSREEKNGRFTKPSYRLFDTKEESGIELTKIQFYQITRKNDQWEYVENFFVWKKEKINCSYFQLKDLSIFYGAQKVLHDCIVKCEYRENSHGNLELVFVPFAIIKSMTFSDMIHYFFVLLRNNDYANYIYNYIIDSTEKKESLPIENLQYDPTILKILERDHNLCRNMYRSIIFYLSYFIFLNFENYLKDILDVKPMFDWEIMKDSFSYDFIHSFRDTVEGKNKINLDEFSRRFSELQLIERVAPVDVEPVSVTQKMDADEISILDMLDRRLLKGKYAPNQIIRKRIYTIETMIFELERSYVFISEEDEKQIITKMITSMLETSRFGNEIYVDNDVHVIYRGFRYGENSELLFLPGMEFFYAYVLAYFLEVGEENYQRFYHSFVSNLETFFKKENYMEVLISQEVFNFLKKYFGSLEKNKIRELIMNKFFVLDPSESDQGIDMDFWVNQALAQVKKWRY